MKSKVTSGDAKLMALAFTFIGISLAQAQSPCPEVFSYRVDPNTQERFGHIEVSNIQGSQTVRLDVELSIAASLAKDNYGSLALVKSTKETASDIERGNPAQYRLKFPLQNILPKIVSIAVNKRIICTGKSDQGHPVTTINLMHTMRTNIQTNGFQFQPLGGSNDVVHRENFPGVIINPPVEYVPQSPIRPNPGRTTISPPVSSASSSCGMPARSTALIPLAINGERVNRGQFPWIAPLFHYTQRSHPTFRCGSTIISIRHLITAAHCIYYINDFIKPERLIAVPGMYDTHDFFEENAKLSDIQSIHPHEHYVHDDDLNDADIAILVLKKVLIFTKYIIPVCLWKDDSDLNLVVNEEGIVAGWGITEKGPTTVPTYIKAVIVTQKACSDNFERMVSQSSRSFCADGRGSVPCNGDSGDGFTLKRGNQHYLRGVVSKGRHDETTLKCDVNKFVMYTDIAPFRVWIRRTMDS